MSGTERDEVVDVVVVGGGAAGLLLAGELALHDVATLVLEPRTEIPTAPRAGTLHARTVQTLLRRGLVEVGRSADVERSRSTEFHFGGMRGATIVTPETEGPPLVGIPQARLEAVLEERALGLGAQVRRGCAVSELAQDDDGVDVRTDDGRVVRARYVAGCDGAHSPTRALITGTTTWPATFSGVLGEVRLLEPAGVPDGWTRGGPGWTLVNRNPAGQSRVLTHDFVAPLPDRRSPVEIDELERIASAIVGAPVPMDRPTHLSRFSDFALLADHYRDRRVFVVGDAAHVHAPLGGQGLNTGLQDAFNLGWKLAMAVAHDAPDALLDTYERERRPVAHSVVENTRVQAMLMRPGPGNEPLREFVSWVLTNTDGARMVGDMISGQSIEHGDGAERTDSPVPRVGSFLPNTVVSTDRGWATVAELLAPGRPVLLVCASADPEILARARDGWSDRVDVVAVDADLGGDRGAVVLCRPDGYVAWSDDARCADVEAVTSALAQWTGAARACAAV